MTVLPIKIYAIESVSVVPNTFYVTAAITSSDRIGVAVGKDHYLKITSVTPRKGPKVSL